MLKSIKAKISNLSKSKSSRKVILLIDFSQSEQTQKKLITTIVFIQLCREQEVE